MQLLSRPVIFYQFLSIHLSCPSIYNKMQSAALSQPVHPVNKRGPYRDLLSVDVPGKKCVYTILSGTPGLSSNHFYFLFNFLFSVQFLFSVLFKFPARSDFCLLFFRYHFFLSVSQLLSSLPFLSFCQPVIVFVTVFSSRQPVIVFVTVFCLSVSLLLPFRHLIFIFTFLSLRFRHSQQYCSPAV